MKGKLKSSGKRHLCSRGMFCRQVPLSCFSVPLPLLLTSLSESLSLAIDRVRARNAMQVGGSRMQPTERPGNEPRILRSESVILEA